MEFFIICEINTVMLRMEVEAEDINTLENN